MSSRTFRTTVVRKESVNGYTYRSTIAAMGGPPCVPLRKSHREAAGLDGGETIDVRLDLDADPREVTPPADFVAALKTVPSVWNRWRELSYSHQREHVEASEDAKKPETRARRIENAIGMIRDHASSRRASKPRTKKPRARKQ